MNWQIGKARCRQGHPYSGDNLRMRSDGGRVCRQCSKERHRRDSVKAKTAKRASTQETKQ